jgi:hypothetical protein
VPAEERGTLLLTIPARSHWLVADLVLLACIVPLFPLLAAAAVIAGNPSLIRAMPWEARLALGACVVTSAVLKWIHAVMRRRLWHVELREGWIELKLSARGMTQVAARWEDIAWFDDSERENVRLKLKGPSGLMDIRLGTPTESDRVSVLDLLARRGVARKE